MHIQAYCVMVGPDTLQGFTTDHHTMLVLSCERTQSKQKTNSFLAIVLLTDIIRMIKLGETVSVDSHTFCETNVL